jgi:hypothetical protein
MYPSRLQRVLQKLLRVGARLQQLRIEAEETVRYFVPHFAALLLTFLHVEERRSELEFKSSRALK